MEKLEKYISDLLWKHDCVVVPGFGGFLLNEQPARFEGASHELLPPGKRISFNRSLINNDGLLHHYVAQVTGQSFESAQSFVTTQMNYWKLQLLNKKPVTLGGLGVLSADVEGRWNFEPVNTVFSKTGFGLESMQLSPLETSPSIRLQAPQKEKKEKAVRVKAAGKRNVWVRRSVVAVSTLCILAVAGFFLAPQITSNEGLASFAFWQESNNAKPVDNQAKKGEPVKEIAPAPDPQPEAVQAESTTNEDALEQPVSASLPVQEYNFYVIGGSFAKEKNAEKFKAQLEKKGYQAEVLHNENGFFRVSYLSNPDSLAASQTLQNIKTEENQAAWLLKW